MAVEFRQNERGSAIMITFIAVALFGAVTYAMLQGTRSNITWLSKEKAKASATSSQDCTNAVNMAQKRLEARGCGARISSNLDGSNTNPGAPTDGSCSIYHVNGGGVKNCLPPPAEPCPNIGDVCSDGSIYVGLSGGVKVYAAPSNEVTTVSHSFDYWGGNFSILIASASWADHGAPAKSNTNGLSNTDFLLTLSDPAAPYYGAALCRTKGPKWYLPARDEVVMLMNNRNIGALSGTVPMPNPFRYASSTETTFDSVSSPSYNGVTINSASGVSRTQSCSPAVCAVRCFRRD